MPDTTPNHYNPDVPPPAGAVQVFDWHEVEDHVVGRYFRSTSWVIHGNNGYIDDVRVLVDGTQQANGCADRLITICHRDTEILTEITPQLARELAEVLVAAADEVEAAIELEWNR
jgi:hypothetical protein